MSTSDNRVLPNSPPPVHYDPELEIRYAVVMYGGVSLAIYGLVRAASASGS